MASWLQRLRMAQTLLASDWFVSEAILWPKQHSFPIQTHFNLWSLRFTELRGWQKRRRRTPWVWKINAPQRRHLRGTIRTRQAPWKRDLSLQKRRQIPRGVLKGQEARPGDILVPRWVKIRRELGRRQKKWPWHLLLCEWGHIRRELVWAPKTWARNLYVLIYREQIHRDLGEWQERGLWWADPLQPSVYRKLCGKQSTRCRQVQVWHGLWATWRVLITGTSSGGRYRGRWANHHNYSKMEVYKNRRVGYHYGWITINTDLFSLPLEWHSSNKKLTWLVLSSFQGSWKIELFSFLLYKNCQFFTFHTYLRNLGKY